MFYKMIENKCKEWYNSENCTVRNLIEYIEKTGQMRDAQIEAIKVYLFLKIGCECKPLEFLFRYGCFNSINLNNIELSTATREYLEENPAATALFEYSRLTNDKGEQVSEKLEKQIKKDPSSIDYDAFFRTAFYGVSYTDYLFSLPMGAGKTYLMAAFIYLDLYFALNEPTNPAFAHNFIIFAPSGLKSSVVPSLKTIQNFNPAWIIPEPAATDIKRMISFEVLDQGKTANKSNKTKNPNVQKIANHQPLSELFGLVAVTNAEKVILDRIQEKSGQINMFEESDDEKDRQANELRNLIGKLPSLSIFIDEVHHAVSDEIKLRAVVTKWAQNHTVNSVIGFSGTPYLEKTEKFKVVDSLSVGTAEITNIVYYYPLIDGVGNFLKRPVVKIADIADSSMIIEKGVREFLDTYRDTVYGDGLTAKLGIYCGTIEKLEEIVYPLVSRIVAEYGLGTDTILKFHKGNKQYKMPADSQMQFDILDKSISKIRIVLLVQIGKEGWDCRSLTGIILSQEGDCPTNMVLQTSCRCLRQVIKGNPETALIYLNESNANKLNVQLEQQHHISLKEFSSADNSKTPLKRYNRTVHLKLPKVDFYQLKINNNKYFSKMSNSMKLVTLKAFWKFCFCLPGDADCQNNLAINRKALEILILGFQQEAIAYIKENNHLFSVANDESCQMNLAILLSKFPVLYNELDSDTQLQVDAIIDKDTRAKSIAWFKYKTVNAHLSYLKSITYLKLEANAIKRMISYYSDIGEMTPLIDFFIWYYGESRSYDSADSRFELAIEPFLDRMSAKQFEQIIEYTNNNRQIWDRGLAYTANNKMMKYAKSVLDDGFDYAKYTHFRFDDKILHPVETVETPTEIDSDSDLPF